MLAFEKGLTQETLLTKVGYTTLEMDLTKVGSGDSDQIRFRLDTRVTLTKVSTTLKSTTQQIRV